VTRFLHRFEDACAGLVCLALVVLPLLPFVSRALGSPAFAEADTLLRHANLWLAFLGALLAAREGKLLHLALRELMPAGAWQRAGDALACALGCAVSVLLARASWDLLVIERENATPLFGGLEVWMTLAILPVAFGGIALRLAWKAHGPAARLAGLAGIALGLWLGAHAAVLEGRPAWPLVCALVLAGALGAPLFVVLGGAAVVLFLSDGIPAAAVPSEIYRLASSPFLAALPLFTFAGYLSTLGRTPERLLAVFRGWLGWLPGGTALVALLLCSFFTVFTGGSGVTILALGGLLLPALVADGYEERFALGLLTAAGSLGLLFPPALPLILYGIAAEAPIEELFLGGLLPGVVLLGVLAVMGLRAGRSARTVRQPFERRAALAALWRARYELLLPVIALVAIFGGFATVVEAAALTAAFALFSQLVLHRSEVRVRRDLLPVLRDCASVLGGVLILLTVATGLSSWMVDAEVPAHILAWVREHVSTRAGFLLCLNGFLLLVGCFLDIYSATFVVVPLILPLAEAYGVHPIHLGIVFVANLELGYLTPPIGLNLFLSSYRFDRSLWAVSRAALPFLVVLALGVLAITYLPWLSTAFLS
jgi:tripartite ATP-independent transporter DctM subunit